MAMRDSNRGLRGMMTTAAVLATCGLAASAFGVPVTPADVLQWGGPSGVGRAVPGAPSGSTWTWYSSSTSGNAHIDANGRVYFVQTFDSNPPIYALTGAQRQRAIFTATNATDLAVYNNFFDSADLGGGVNIAFQSTSGGGAINFSGVNSTIRVSGNYVANGVGINGTGINYNTNTPNAGPINNSRVYLSQLSSAPTQMSQRADLITLVDATGASTAAPISNVYTGTNFPGFGTQNVALNSSGQMMLAVSVPTQTGVWIGTNPTAAPFGNNTALVMPTGSGGYTVVGQAGQVAPGVTAIPQARYRQGGQNGVGGFTMHLNRNGEAFYDAQLVNTGTVSSTNDNAAYIRTTAGVNTLVWREGSIAPDSGSSLFGGSPSSPKFSNAGALMHLGLTTGTGDVVTSGDTQNNSGLYFASLSSGSPTLTKVVRRNDSAPGFTSGDNVRIGAMQTSSYRFNNGGQYLYTSTLQGSGVTASVAPVYNSIFVGIQNILLSVNTAGTQGNDAAIVTGNVNGGSQIIARTGDPAPGSGGLFFNIEISSAALAMNNNGDVLFNTGLTPYAPGQSIGIGGGGPLSSVLPAGAPAMYGWTSSFGLVKLLQIGDVVEVDPGVFKTLASLPTVLQTDNGDGASAGFSDNGQFVVTAQFTDNTQAVIKLTVPAPASAGLAMLGLGVLARRRRK